MKKPNQFWTSDELRAMGVECGNNCLIHKTSILVNAHELKLGNDVRIDGFCTISAGIGITIGNNVHVAGYVSLFGAAGIEVGNYASIASGSKVYSISDDVMGRGLVGPCVDESTRFLHKGKVVLGDHSVLAVNVVVMPGAQLSKGSTVLPFSVYTNREAHDLYNVYQGTPAKYVKDKLPGFTRLVMTEEAHVDNDDANGDY